MTKIVSYWNSPFYFTHSFDYSIIDNGGKFTRNQYGDIVFTFGKNLGKRASDDLGYLEWMLKQDFSYHTKLIINKIHSGQLKQCNIGTMLLSGLPVIFLSSLWRVYITIQFVRKWIYNFSNPFLAPNL